MFLNCRKYKLSGLSNILLIFANLVFSYQTMIICKLSNIFPLKSVEIKIAVELIKVENMHVDL
jgi:hypothetical protein